MLQKFQKKRIYKILFFITSLVILYLATIPKDLAWDYHYADKIKHIFAFFTLSLLLNRASSSIKTRFRNMISLLLFGIFIEIVQLFSPMRTSSIYDVLADLIGILLFQSLYTLLKIVKAKVK